jgi:5-deoxy-glucuronate isomerase
MKIKQPVGGFAKGYNAITEINGKFSNMLMNYGILHLEKDKSFSFDEELEKVVILLSGEIEAKFGDTKVKVSRESCFDNSIWTLNLDKNTGYELIGVSDNAELALISTENEAQFQPHIYDTSNTTNEVRGEGTMEDCGRRIVRTSMDKTLTPHSNIMFGEDVHFPGRWAGFPSHSHNQPEIYFYKFLPENGFGLIKIGNEGELLEQNDTLTIDPDLVHPQVGAPGYAMYFLWIIRHLKDNPYLGPDFEEEHLWVEKPGAKYWPNLDN